MLVRFTSILLITVVLCTSFTRLVFYAGYEMNKAYISKVLCENKAKPMLHCNGKCFLNKKIKQAEEKEKQSLSLTKSNLELLAYERFHFKCFTFQTDEYLIPSITSYLFYRIAKLLQPPQI